MWYAIYRTVDGALVSTGTSVAGDVELRAAGIAKVELGETWNRNGLTWDANRQTFVAAPSSPPASLSPLDFLRRFTVQERVAIRAAAATDPIIADFLDLLNRATEVHIDSPDTVAGVNYLVSIGLLSAARATEVLAP